MDLEKQATSSNHLAASALKRKMRRKEKESSDCVQHFLEAVLIGISNNRRNTKSHCRRLVLCYSYAKAGWLALRGMWFKKQGSHRGIFRRAGSRQHINGRLLCIFNAEFLLSYTAYRQLAAIAVFQYHLENAVSHSIERLMVG